ncbi:MAG: 1-phosphofructokinase [Lachnospiraceae bacterium]|nr:1-phosphofructokinase [Lachnospiraceae bacterium]
MIYTVTLNPALDKTVEIPSLTPGSVNRIVSMRTDPGGKVSKVIAQLGGKSIAVGILGGAVGRSIKNALENMSIESDFLFVEGETRTNLKIIDPVNHTNTDINEPGVEVSEEILQEILERLIARIVPGDLVVLSGSLPLGAPADIYRSWVKACRLKGAKVFLDVDGALLGVGVQASPYLIKPNEHELRAMLGQRLETVEELAEAAYGLCKQYGISKIVVSLGADGALYVTEKETIRARGLKVPVGSTVGAGDSVVAAMAVAEERGMSLVDAVRLSTATGAANVMCSGSQAAEYAQIEELMPKVVIRYSPGFGSCAPHNSVPAPA